MTGRVIKKPSHDTAAAGLAAVVEPVGGRHRRTAPIAPRSAGSMLPRWMALASPELTPSTAAQLERVTPVAGGDGQQGVLSVRSLLRIVSVAQVDRILAGEAST